MNRGFRRPSPALIVACIALFVALGGTVYAAVGQIDGKAIKLKSMPGNRLVPDSVPGNRLKAGTIPGNRLERDSITGSQVDAATLGQVPSAVHADTADSAHDAETALHAVDAITATKVNGHTAGCGPGTRPFAGACWQTESSGAAVTAPTAAESCAAQGGELPDALSLAAFSKRPGIELDDGDEWTGDLTNVTAADLYAVVTVSSAAVIKSALSSAARKYRCVIPLVN
jgi:hypothetical protein